MVHTQGIICQSCYMGSSKGHTVLFLLLLVIMLDMPVNSREIEHSEPARLPLPVTPITPTNPKVESMVGSSDVVMQLQPEDKSIRLLLLYDDIMNSTDEENRRRAASLRLDTSETSSEELRSVLFAQYGIDFDTGAVEDRIETSQARFEIVEAHRMAIDSKDNNLVLLSGDVTVRLFGSEKEQVIEVSASSLVVDMDAKLVAALGSVRFSDVQDETIEQIDARIISYRWESGHLIVRDGTTSIERTNSEGDTVELFTSGQQISYSGDRSVITFDKGVVATASKDPYASISADKLMIIEGGDMFVQNAWISIGRVPLVWLPFVFYPGQTFIFNPAIGFDTDRGLFFSTTTELYGTYPGIEKSDTSSFSTLLETDQNEEKIQDGWVYRSRPDEDQMSSAQRWARSSKSYMVLLFDTYSDRGTFVGLDSVNNFLSNTHKLGLYGGIALPGRIPVISSVYDIPDVRYAIEASYKIDTKFLDLDMQLPVYSDPRVKKDFGNRLTSFSIGALRGTQAFPTSFNNDITSYSWTMKASATIPTEAINPYISRFSINQLGAKAVWKSNTKTDGPGYSLSSLVIPELNFGLSGTLLTLQKKGRASDGKETDDLQDDKSVESSEMTEELFEGLPIASLYEIPSSDVAKTASGSLDQSSLKVSYRLNNVLSYSMHEIASASANQQLYGKVSGAVTVEGYVAPSWFSFNTEMTPTITFSADDEDNKGRIILDTVAKSSIPLIGLSHQLSFRLYSLDWESPNPSNETWGTWTSTDVLRHTISLSRPLVLGEGTMTMSLSADLPPKNVSLTPKIAYVYQSLSTSISQRFNENESGYLVPGTMQWTFNYKEKDMFVVDATMLYSFKDLLDTPNAFFDPLTIKLSSSQFLFKSYLTLSQSFDFAAKDLLFNSMVAKISIPWLNIAFYSKGAATSLTPIALDVETRLEGFETYWWKKRIGLRLDLISSFRYGFSDMRETSWRFTLITGFSIAEFLELQLEVKSANRGFSRYGSILELGKDLLRSFDFFGDGRLSTQFNMESISFHLVHKMKDWDLHCKYEGSVVLSDLEWRWKPVFSIFLQWKAIPEIKVDRSF